MSFRFTKMHGAGNDFVILDRLTGAPLPDVALAKRLANRHFGVGCDQIMVIEAATAGSAFAYRIFNADGSNAGQCGNGARCVARYLRERHALADGALLDSPGGVIGVKFLADGEVELAMGEPRFAPADIPFAAPQQQSLYRLSVHGEALDIAALSMGNPHAVLQVPAVAGAAVDVLGPAIEKHSAFPDRANVSFVEVLSRTHVRLRVWERGVGETLACGSAACATMVALVRRGLLDDAVAVDLPGGRLRVRWPGAGNVYLAGPAEFVFDGEYYP